MLIEAPNWSLDGDALFLNGARCALALDLRRPTAG